MDERKAIQISASTFRTIDGLTISILYALCSDGTIWIFDPDPAEKEKHWKKLPTIPRR